MSDGSVITKQQNTVYLKPAADFSPFEWGGKCMRVGDITKSDGASPIDDEE